MKHIVGQALLLMLGSSLGIAQPRAQQLNSAYFEVLGNTRLYSFNIDTVFPRNWGVRVGGAIDAIDFNTGRSDGEPIESAIFFSTVNYFIGERPNLLELGVGPMFGYNRGSLWEFLELPAVTTTVGYRKQDERGVVRVGFTPIWTRGKVFLSLGVSFGVGFR